MGDECLEKEQLLKSDDYKNGKNLYGNIRIIIKHQIEESRDKSSAISFEN